MAQVIFTQDELAALAKLIAPLIVVPSAPSPAPAPTPIPAPAPSPSGVTWMYLNGVKTLAGDFTGAMQTVNYQHATPNGFNGGTTDILVTSQVPWGYFIPYWAADFKLPNKYKYLLFSLKPTITGDTFSIHSERVGDSALPAIEVLNYGPACVAGKWGSYKVPLADLGVGADSTLYKVIIQTHTDKANSWEMDAIGFL